MARAKSLSDSLSAVGLVGMSEVSDLEISRSISARVWIRQLL